MINVIFLPNQVFPIEDGSLCGKPELPLGGQVQVIRMIIMIIMMVVLLYC